MLMIVLQSREARIGVRHCAAGGLATQAPAGVSHQLSLLLAAVMQRCPLLARTLKFIQEWFIVEAYASPSLCKATAG